jgi:hypothetical protein
MGEIMGRRPAIREVARARARYEAAIGAVLACEERSVGEDSSDLALLSASIELLNKVHQVHLAFIQFADLRFRGAVADVDELKRRVFRLEMRLNKMSKDVRPPSA